MSSSAWRVPIYSQDPNKVKECLDGLVNEKGGGFTNHDIVDMARPEDHYMHGMFEWDDTVAAERYREEQAGSIVRLLVIVDEEDEEPTKSREFYFEKSEAKAYVPTYTILRNETMKNRLLEEAKAELRSFEVKYRCLTELAEVFDAIDALETA